MTSTTDQPLPVDEELTHRIGKINDEIERFEAKVEIDASWADADVADDIDTYRTAARRQVEAWKAYVDHLRVRAALAGMEARDAHDHVDAAFAAAQPELDKAWAAADAAFASLSAGARDAATHLRDAARAALHTLDRLDEQRGSMS